jgi:hypothetical protein
MIWYGTSRAEIAKTIRNGETERFLKGLGIPFANIKEDTEHPSLKYPAIEQNLDTLGRGTTESKIN